MLLRDKRFWTVVADGLASGATLLIGHFVVPEYMDIALWAIYQTVAAVIIGVYTVERKVDRLSMEIKRQYLRRK
jgi:hypothetical protein